MAGIASHSSRARHLASLLSLATPAPEVFMSTVPTEKPLHSLEEWDDFLEGRYKEGRNKEEFRVYDAQAQPGVAEFYRLNHENQTVEYVLAKELEYFSLQKGLKTVW